MARKALLMSGGGAKGAFTVGALDVLFNEKNLDFDIISGTSTGSLITALARPERIQDLKQIYTTVTNDDILRNTNLLSNIRYNRAYIYDTWPLVDKINEEVTAADFDVYKNTSKLIFLTAINLKTGGITVFSNKPESDLGEVKQNYQVIEVDSLEMYRDVLLASSSQAGFLPPVKIHGEYYVDGGNRDVIPVSVAVDQEPDEVYVLSNNPLVRQYAPFEYEGANLVEYIQRAISIFLQDVRDNDMKLLTEHVNNIIRIAPENDLDPENPTGLNFNVDLMTFWMRNGRDLARLI